MGGKTGSWTDEFAAGRLGATGLDQARAATTDYAIDGLLPATGASVWFGAGSVGKTQLLLWMAAHLAAPAGAGVDRWLGQPIRRRGQVLVLSAEDLREHLLGRLAGILDGLRAGGATFDPEQVGRRIHLLAFLSLSEAEFAGGTPALFRRRGSAWRPTRLLRELEAAIDLWNGAHDGEERIIGVVMDSAVSLCGFELANTEATTGFLFHLNKVARRQELFWAVIGHTPKSARADANDPDAGAVERLRGSAMWSTTPRSVVEVRLGTEDERGQLAAAGVRVGPRDLVRLRVVKANTRAADLAPRLLRREVDGAFQDLTPLLAVNQHGAGTDQDLKKGGQHSTSASGQATIQAVVDLIRTLTGGKPDATFTRPELVALIEKQRDTVPALAALDLEMRGKHRARGNLAQLLWQLSQAGLIKSNRRGPSVVIDLDRPVATAAGRLSRG